MELTQFNNNDNQGEQSKKKFTTKDFIRILESWLLIALAVIIGAHTSDNINYDSFGTLALVVLSLSLLNVILKPFLIFFTLPFILVTFGLGIWVINALLLLLVSKVVSGFEVGSMTSALWGALVISLVSMIANQFITKKFPLESLYRRKQKGYKLTKADDDVIDI